MVEGPGCRLKGEKIKAKFIGTVLQDVSGNAVQVKKVKVTPAGKNFSVLIGKKVEDVKTLGKELFMIFGEKCIRVHFLMAGSHWVNGQRGDRDPCKAAENPTLELLLSGDTLAFHKSAVEIRDSQTCIERFEALKHLDICSPLFNHKAAVSLIMEQKDRHMCDILLDQVMLPGVGNIIKNEGLFDSGIKPDATIEDITEDHVSHLVHMTRDFSMLFYKCRKTGEALNKYYKIYNQKKCKQCSSKIVITRMGDDSQRITYFCPNCQNNSLKCLPKKNSLLGWVVNSINKDNKEWTCEICTLINLPTALACTACNSPRHKDLKAKTLETKPTVTVKHCSSSKRKSDELETNLKPPVNKKVKSEQQSPAVESKIPLCQHQVPCAMLEVRKQGENYRRMFFTCKLPKAKQCKFFQWADTEFPFCSHSKRAVIRTVLKQGPNNGRKFFACSMNKNKQCQFFEWANGYQ